MAEQHEVEVKVLAIDKEVVERTLLSLGATKIFDDVLEMHSFRPDNDTIGLIRVRKEGDETFLVMKTKKEKGFASSTKEYSVKVDDYATAVKMFTLLGFKNRWQYNKHRTSYQLGTTRFEFDKLLGEYDFVPAYLEIEGASEEEVKKALSLLNIPASQAKNWTGGNVIRYYQKK